MKMTQFLINCRVALFIVLLPSVLTAQKTVPADSLYQLKKAPVNMRSARSIIDTAGKQGKNVHDVLVQIANLVPQ